jgi:hypothetical protein
MVTSEEQIHPTVCSNLCAGRSLIMWLKIVKCPDAGYDKAGDVFFSKAKQYLL